MELIGRRTSGASEFARIEAQPLRNLSTATAVKPRFFSNWREANLRSFIFTISDLRLTTGRSTKAEDRNAKSQTPNTEKLQVSIAHDHSGDSAADVPSQRRIVTWWDTACSGSGDSAADTTSRSEMGFLCPANGTWIGPGGAVVSGRT